MLPLGCKQNLVGQERGAVEGETTESEELEMIYKRGGDKNGPDGTCSKCGKRRKCGVYHTDFTVNGQRFRQSLGTTDWRKAQSEESRLRAQAEEGTLTPASTSLARQPFGQAASEYVMARKLSHRGQIQLS